jgi:hypothetical protein
MAKKVETIVTLTDDLDGSKADRTVMFGFGGFSYEIDLNKKNATVLEKTLAPYIAAARKVPSKPRRNGRSRANGRAGAGTGADLAAVREWARANGYEVADRGRIPAAVSDAYHASR